MDNKIKYSKQDIRIKIMIDMLTDTQLHVLMWNQI
jgi:hypothetical protein